MLLIVEQWNKVVTRPHAPFPRQWRLLFPLLRQRTFRVKRLTVGSVCAGKPVQPDVIQSSLEQLPALELPL